MVMNRDGKLKFGRCCRLLAGLATLICGLAGAVRAQHAVVPQFEVSGGYSYVRANPSNSNGGFNLNGGSASFAYNITDRYAVVGDFGAYRFSGLPSRVDSTMYTYVFGPRVSFRKSPRLSLFVQGLLGGGRLNASAGGVNAGENAFAMALGGGVDLHLHSHLSIRLVQADYLLTRFASVAGNTETQNDARISAGLVFRFGSK